MSSSIFCPPEGVFRVIFFYVGQGDCALLIIPDGKGHKYVLFDANYDSDEKAVDVAKVLAGQIPEGELIFINSHPHKDHLDGLEDIHKAVKIGEIWNSGHIPHKDDRKHYDKMMKIVDEIGKDKEFFLRGSHDMNVVHTDAEETSHIDKKIGDVDYQVFSPAQYVCDDLAEESWESRRNRIHEQCGVMKFTYLGKSILLSADADVYAWRDHITPGHTDALKADVLAGLHHGSWSTVMISDDDENPYTEHLDHISPEHIVLSAPKDSPHGHPHQQALDVFGEYVDADHIYHLGSKEQSLVADIDATGDLQVYWSDVVPENSDDDSDRDKKNSAYPSFSVGNKFVPSVKGGAWRSF